MYFNFTFANKNKFILLLQSDKDTSCLNMKAINLSEIKNKYRTIKHERRINGTVNISTFGITGNMCYTRS